MMQEWSCQWSSNSLELGNRYEPYWRCLLLQFSHQLSLHKQEYIWSITTPLLDVWLRLSSRHGCRWCYDCRLMDIVKWTKWEVPLMDIFNSILNSFCKREYMDLSISLIWDEKVEYVWGHKFQHVVEFLLPYWRFRDAFDLFWIWEEQASW